jgi:hypothetical protein
VREKERDKRKKVLRNLTQKICCRLNDLLCPPIQRDGQITKKPYTNILMI